MGNAYAYRGRLMPALLLAAFAVLVVVAVLALTAGPAAAFGSYEHSSASSCGSCHKVNTDTPPTNADCQTCHTGGFEAHAKGGVASTCWTCHTPGQDMTSVQTAAGCGAAAAGAGCHGAAGHIGSTPTTCTTCHTPSTGATAPGQSAHHKAAVTDVTVKALLTGKFTTSSITLGKTAKATGLAKSVRAGYVVTAQVYKKGASGAFAKLGTPKKAIWTQSTSKWTLSFKPTKKGVYRLQVKVPAVPGTNGNATAISAKTITTKTLTVK
jgi:hypothetical protein